MTLEKIKRKAARLDNPEKKKREEIEKLTIEFEKVRERILEGEDYIDQHLGHEEAVDEFKKLLKRTAEINSSLIEMEEDPMGRGSKRGGDHNEEDR